MDPELTKVANQSALQRRAATPLWMIGLMAISGLTLIAAGAVVARAWSVERAAQEELHRLESEASESWKKVLGADRSMKDWMEKRTSKEDSQEWMELFAELSNPYWRAQLRSLLTIGEVVPTQEEQRVAATHETELEGPSILEDPKDQSPRAAWKRYPDLVQSFVSEHEELITRIERLCDSDQLVYLPLVDRGGETVLDFNIASASHLLFLGLVQAVADRDSPKVAKRLEVLDLLWRKFDYWGYMPYRTDLITGLHLAMDHQMLRREDGGVWIDRIDAGDHSVLEAMVAQQHASDFERFQKEVPAGFVPSLRLSIYRTIFRRDTYRMADTLMNNPNSQNAMLRSRNDGVKVRLAVLEFMERNQRVPKDLMELSTLGLPLGGFDLGEFSYERKDDRTAFFDYRSKRIQVPDEYYPIDTRVLLKVEP